jgi:cytidyltransferase-like protein
LNDRRFLGTVFALELAGGEATVRSVSERTELGQDFVNSNAERLRLRGLLKREGSRLSLTEKGRKSIRVVFIGGGFEVIHPGHIYTIEKARKLGDVLIVVVARDSTILRRKGRDPIASESERMRLLSSLRQVDASILGVEGDIYLTLEKVRPDIVALGYDQHHAESEILREGARRGMELRVVRLDAHRPEIKTSRLLRET